MHTQLDRAKSDYTRAKDIASKGYERVLTAKKWHAHRLSVADNMHDKVEALQTSLRLLKAEVDAQTGTPTPANLIAYGSPASNHSNAGSYTSNFTPPHSSHHGDVGSYASNFSPPTWLRVLPTLVSAHQTKILQMRLLQVKPLRKISWLKSMTML